MSADEECRTSIGPIVPGVDFGHDLRDIGGTARFHLTAVRLRPIDEYQCFLERTSIAMKCKLAALSPDRRSHRLVRRSLEITARLRNRRAAIAWVVAYVLSLQALVTCLVDARRLWDFNSLASICTSGASDHSQDGSPSPARHEDRGCCVLCGTPGLAAADPDLANSLLARLEHGQLLKPFDFLSLSTAIAGQPFQPRAPPAVA